jgi:hypothetical protein
MSSGGLPPISVASTTIGFISFGLTLLTLIRVTWGNIMTIMDAPTQVHYSLANLKQALYEERAAVHRATKLALRRRDNALIQDPMLPLHSNRKSAHLDPDGGYSGASLKIMQETVRKLCRDFRRLERPFLRPDLPITREGWESQKEKSLQEEAERYRYQEEGFTGDYCNLTLGKRIVWLRSKTAVNSLWISLERIQMRRVARECTEALQDLHYIQSNLRDLKLIKTPRPVSVRSRRRRSVRRRSTSSYSERESDDRMHVRRSYGDR